MSPRPHFIFAPGAGAGSSHPWMQRWSVFLRTLGDVRLFDYAYTADGKHRPDPLPKLMAKHRAVLEDQRRANQGPIFLIGKSMGSRVGCHLALEEPVAGVICFGYPLCGGGDCRKLRDRVLLNLSTPVLFIQGTRDKLCPLETLAPIRQSMQAENDLHIVPGGDHSLLVTKTQLKADGQTQAQVDTQILKAIETFVVRRIKSV